MMDVPARADSDPRRFQAAGGGLWPPVTSHDGTEGRATEGKGEESNPCKCLHAPLGYSRTSGADVAAPTDESTQHPRGRPNATQS